MFNNTVQMAITMVPAAVGDIVINGKSAPGTWYARGRGIDDVNAHRCGTAAGPVPFRRASSPAGLTRSVEVLASVSGGDVEQQVDRAR